MKRMSVLAALSMVTLLAATTAFAGGAACSGQDEASAKACKVGTSAKMAGSEGGHCDMGKGTNAMTSGKCALGANQMVYSFAVPTAECDNCADGITKALMAQEGVHCAHVDLKNRVAYIVADKQMDKNALAKCIKTAGFKNSYRGEGKTVRAEFVKMTASADKDASCCAAKTKEKV